MMTSIYERLFGPERFLYLHIPKTAGISLRTVIEKQFRPEEILQDTYFMSDLVKLSKREVGRYRLIRGHIPYSAVHKVPGTPHIITVLRDPVERAISNLRHVKSRGGNFWLYEHFDLTRMSLDDLIKEPLVQDWMRDYQLKWIAGDFNLANFTEPMIFQVPKTVDEEFLERGKKRLSGIEFVGITERFDESLRLLCDTFGWPREEQPPALNRKEDRHGAEEQVSEKSIDTVRSLTEYDRRFYDFAYALFEKRLNK